MITSKNKNMAAASAQGNSPRNGFTLIEMAITIVILSLILAPLYGIILEQRTEKRAMQQDSIDKSLLTSLSLYLRENGAYPCPADATLAADDPNFGQEMGRTVTLPAAAQTRCNTALPVNSVIQGDLPVAALGLPFQAAANLQGRKYIYAVTNGLTGSTSYNGIGSLRILSGVTDTRVITATAPFVVVNPGPDGRGSYSLNGGPASFIQCLGTLVPPEGWAENCNNDADFRDAPYAALDMDNINNSNYFDDQIVYSIAKDESTLWVMRPDPANPGRMNMVNRNDGNIGINVPTPTAPLHVQGSVRVQDGDLNVDRRVRSRNFCYGGTLTACAP